MSDSEKQAACDGALHAAAKLMIDEFESPVEMVMDRLFTFSIAQSVHVVGSARTAELLREFADTVEGGAFNHITHAKRRASH